MNPVRPNGQSSGAREGFSRRLALRYLAGASGTAALLASMEWNRVLARATPRSQGEAGQPPNHFVLDGEEMHITYDATTDTGKPSLTYQGPFGSQSFVGDQLLIEETALGRLVTCDLGPFPDRGNLWLTLLLPAFNPMNAGDAPASFDTLAILKWRVSTIVGPPREGALEAYEVVPLEGTAQFVMF